MKIINLRNLKQTIFKIILFLIYILNLAAFIESQCSTKNGCLIRKKIMSYVTVVGKNGKPNIKRSAINYKILYVFTDRLIFYSSPNPASAALEAETPLQLNEQESRIERVIFYGDIILECGKYKNKLCHAQEYRNKDQIESFKLIQKKLKNNPDALCLLIPFFENEYHKSHDKIAYLCGTEIKDLYNIISLKQYLSRQIETYQLKIALDRYNGFNGMLRKQFNVVLKTKEGQKPVIAKIFIKGIVFNKNDLTAEMIKYFSFYDLRKYAYGAFKVKDGLAKKKIPNNWSEGISPQPHPDCCIYLKGETSEEVFCVANKSGGIENAPDICKAKIDKIYQEIRISMRGIYFAESFHQIQNNKNVISNCKSKEYISFRHRAEKTIQNSIETDCKLIMTYINSDDFKKKYDWCKKNFFDELKLELRLMSLKDERVFQSINNCIYNNKSYASIFSVENFDSNEIFYCIFL